ncbi:Cytochrome P450 CYP6 [Frankliniella occidentalis]|nr:Cytochrome P450 CYP6 [Frankliniella occidentalis]
MFLLLLLVLAALALGLAYAALRARHAYWRRRGVPGPECSVPFGNYKDAILGRKGMGDIMFDVYQK